MNEIRWKRGVPTEKECRECWLFDGGNSNEPEWSHNIRPQSTRPCDWGKRSWYAAVRILPPEAAESPDDWVTQDRVPMRSGIDRGWWESDADPVPPDVAKFWTATECHQGLCHGQLHKSSRQTVLHVRCRRKDLPQVPTIQESQTVEQKPEGPQPGQWWQWGQLIVYVIGKAIGRDEYAVQEEDGEVYGRHLNGWQHLPDCTGWDWQPTPPKKKQRKWVTEQWITDGESPNPDIADGHLWESTDEVREVPL